MRLPICPATAVRRHDHDGAPEPDVERPPVAPAAGHRRDRHHLGRPLVAVEPGDLLRRHRADRTGEQGRGANRVEARDQTAAAADPTALAASMSAAAAKAAAAAASPILLGTLTPAGSSGLIGNLFKFPTDPMPSGARMFLRVKESGAPGSLCRTTPVAPLPASGVPLHILTPAPVSTSATQLAGMVSGFSGVQTGTPAGTTVYIIQTVADARLRKGCSSDCSAG